MFELRKGLPSDAEALGAFATRCFYATFAAHNSAEDMALYTSVAFDPARQREELSDARNRFVLAVAEGAIAGFSMLQPGSREACVPDVNAIELVRLYVEARWHGQGVARTLMDDAIAEARRAGHTTLWLGVWEHNQRALAFYKKHGFAEAGSHIFELGNDRQRDLILARPI